MCQPKSGGLGYNTLWVHSHYKLCCFLHKSILPALMVHYCVCKWTIIVIRVKRSLLWTNLHVHIFKNNNIHRRGMLSNHGHYIFCLVDLSFKALFFGLVTKYVCGPCSTISLHDFSRVLTVLPGASISPSLCWLQSQLLFNSFIFIFLNTGNIGCWLVVCACAVKFDVHCWRHVCITEVAQWLTVMSHSNFIIPHWMSCWHPETVLCQIL